MYKKKRIACYMQFAKSSGLLFLKQVIPMLLIRER
jgi:hypothetical protein